MAKRPVSSMDVILKLVPEATWRAFALSTEEAFVMSLVNDKLTVREMIATCGLGEQATTDVLQRLYRHGLIALDSNERHPTFDSVDQIEGSKPRIEVDVEMLSRRQQPRKRAASRPDVIVTAEVTLDGESSRPGIGRSEHSHPGIGGSRSRQTTHDSMNAATLDIDDETRRSINRKYNEIKFCSARVFLELAEAYGSEDLEENFLRLSRTYHPDQFLDRNIGKYLPRVHKVYEHLTRCYKQLLDALAKAPLTPNPSRSVVRAQPSPAPFSASAPGAISASRRVGPKRPAGPAAPSETAAAPIAQPPLRGAAREPLVFKKTPPSEPAPVRSMGKDAARSPSFGPRTDSRSGSKGPDSTPPSFGPRTDPRSSGTVPDSTPAPGSPPPLPAVDAFAASSATPHATLTRMPPLQNSAGKKEIASSPRVSYASRGVDEQSPQASFWRRAAAKRQEQREQEAGVPPSFSNSAPEATSEPPMYDDGPLNLQLHPIERQGLRLYAIGASLLLNDEVATAQPFCRAAAAQLGGFPYLVAQIDQMSRRE